MPIWLIFLLVFAFLVGVLMLLIGFDVFIAPKLKNKKRDD